MTDPATAWLTVALAILFTLATIALACAAGYEDDQP